MRADLCFLTYLQSENYFHSFSFIQSGIIAVVFKEEYTYAHPHNLQQKIFLNNALVSGLLVLSTYSFTCCFGISLIFQTICSCKFCYSEVALCFQWLQTRYLSDHFSFVSQAAQWYQSIIPTPCLLALVARRYNCSSTGPMWRVKQ